MTHPENALVMTVHAEIHRFEYSTILDAETCANCRGLDGKTAEKESDLPTAPNPQCTSPTGCRCMVIEIRD